jgi:hypothetical protein
LLFYLFIYFCSGKGKETSKILTTTADRVQAYLQDLLVEERELEEE